jgi:enoyl-CoA hydratase/carnithine racemase
MEAVTVERLDDSIALVTLNRPERLNAIDGSMLDAMDAVLEDLENTAKWRVAIVTGAGRAFCSGADRSGTGASWTPAAATPWKSMWDAQCRLTDQLTRLYELPIPTIAAVNGAAVGGGLAIALHCDLRLAAPNARFASAFLTAGFSSMDMGTSYLLPKIIGVGAARELMLTGRIIDADAALNLGLVNQVAEGLLDTAATLAHEIAMNNPYGVWQTKVGLNSALDAPSLRHAKELENRIQVMSSLTGNPREAGRAFIERRPPVWEPL